MKNSLIKLFLCASICAFFPKFSMAQSQLIVTLNNNNLETFALNDISSIKFVAETLNLKMYNGNLHSWNISDIANYRFEGVGGLNNIESNIGILQVYPNPIIEQTVVSFSTQETQQIQIALIDFLGRTVQEVYSGKHQGTQNYTFKPNVLKGIYLLRLTSENGTLNQSILVQ
jgi:hypothetical protein